MSTTAVISDDFITPQTSNLGPIPPGIWQPNTATRNLTGPTISGTTDISGGTWNFIEATGSVNLIYTAPSGSYDISNLITVFLQNVTFSAGFQLTLNSVSDGSQSANGTPSGTDIVWNLSNFTINLTDINSITFIVFGLSGTTGTIDAIGFTQICVARDTMVLMANGTEKPIQDIKRGDYVAGNTDFKPMCKVARVIHTKLPPMAPVSLIKISKNALGGNKPSANTIISAGHPIFHNGDRYRAKMFRKIKGIKYHSKRKTVAKDILPPNEDGTYSLYNIQYEHDGYFVANGLVVDSISPLSIYASLPKELYFDQKLYDNPINIIKPDLKKKLIKKNNI